MAVAGAQDSITVTVTQWPGVVSQPHRFDGVEYVLGTREIGHIHGDHLVDIPLPTRVRDRVVAEGRAEPHHLLVDSGWISVYLRRPADVQTAIDLLRESFEIAARQKARKE